MIWHTNYMRLLMHFLMPSRFEPCGLTQLISFRYGTVPIVRETGGLKDTVKPYNEYENSGDGFSFSNYNADEMLAVINYSKHIFFDKKREWNQIVDRAWPMISLGMLRNSNMRDYTITLLVNKIFCKICAFCITFCPAIHGGVFCTHL